MTLKKPLELPKMSPGDPSLALIFFQNEYWKPLTGPNFEYWPLETIPLDIIMRVPANLLKKCDTKKCDLLDVIRKYTHKVA